LDDGYIAGLPEGLAKEFKMEVYTVKVDSHSTIKWYQNGKRHRTDGPAVECANGDKEWYVEGKLHRTDGPAIEYADGDKKWYVEGKLHRTDGPAIEIANGDKAWYINGEEYTEEEFKKKMNIDQYDGLFKSITKQKLKQKPKNSNQLSPFWEEASAVSLGDKEKQFWLNSLLHWCQDSRQTGSQVYGKYYRKDSSDKDLIVKIPRQALGPSGGLVSLIGAEQAKYCRKGTCRVKIGDVDFILTTEQKIFNSWVKITQFLKDNPPPNKLETIKMFDMMDSGEDYQQYYEKKFGWARSVDHIVGQFAEIGTSYHEVAGVFSESHNTYCVLKTFANKCHVMTGQKVNSLQSYFGEKLDTAQFYAIVPINRIKKCVPKITTKGKTMIEEETYSTEPSQEKRAYKDALKSSGRKMKGHVQHGMAIGAATEGANYAYQQVAHVLKTQFGVSDETLNDPLKREFITFAALAVTHMGATIFDEVPGMDKVTEGCELAIEGKAKDNTGAMIQHLLPMLMNVSKAMDPATHMQRIAEEAERQRVAVDNSDQEAHTEATALEQEQEQPKAKVQAIKG